MCNRYIDIGANLTDDMFEGKYFGKPRHDPDLDNVLDRSEEHHVPKLMVTIGSSHDITKTLAICSKRPSMLYPTLGIHPTRCTEFEKNPKLLDLLRKRLNDGNVKYAAYGEFGLDYDRTKFCPITVQKKWFRAQLELAVESRLPLFLHCRAAADDFIDILEPFLPRLAGGVVHSFTGSVDEVRRMLDLGLYIGINGCSLKTEENLEAMKVVPLDRLMLETDCPYCGVKATHAGHKHIKTVWQTKPNHKYDPTLLVKGRCEPCQIIQVAEVVAAVRGITVEEVARAAWANTAEVFTVLEAGEFQ